MYVNYGNYSLSCFPILTGSAAWQLFRIVLVLPMLIWRPTAAAFLTTLSAFICISLCRLRYVICKVYVSNNSANGFFAEAWSPSWKFDDQPINPVGVYFFFLYFCSKHYLYFDLKNVSFVCPTNCALHLLRRGWDDVVLQDNNESLIYMRYAHWLHCLSFFFFFFHLLLIFFFIFFQCSVFFRRWLWWQY